jgi:hypothetical protein
MHFQYIYCVSTSRWIDTEQAGNSYNTNRAKRLTNDYFMTFKILWDDLDHTFFLCKPHIVFAPDHILLYNSLKMARTVRYL